MPSKTALCFIIFFLLVMGIGIVMHFTGYTFQVVDQIYCRNHFPWTASAPELFCDYRSGDDLFENDFIVREYQYLAKNPYQHSFTERILTGYPLGASYVSSSYTLFFALSASLPTYSSINFSALFILFIGFSLGYAIIRLLDFRRGFAVLSGFLSITLAHVSLFETWNLALLGYGFLILGVLLFYKKNKIYPFLIFAALGAFLIISSSIYQLYLYTLINLILLGLFYFEVGNRKKYLIAGGVIVLIFMSVSLLLNFSLIRHYEFLSVSQKVGHTVAFRDLLELKWISLDPAGWLSGDFLMPHRAAFEKLRTLFPYSQFAEATDFFQNNLQGSTRLGPGIGYLMLAGIGIVQLWKRKERAYCMIVLFWFLYYIGILQLLLSAIGEPFRSETSPRANYLFYLFGSYAVLTALQNIIEKPDALQKWTKRIVWVVLGYFGFLSLGFIAKGKFFFGNVPIVILSLVFSGIGFAWATRRIKITAWWGKYAMSACLVIGVALPAFAKLFLGFSPAVLAVLPSKLYYPETEFVRSLKNIPVTRAALVRTAGGKTMDPNESVQLGMRTITGSRNPISAAYVDLYHYHRLIAEGQENQSAAFVEFTQDNLYTNSNMYAWNLPAKELVLTDTTKRYFAMHQVDAIIGSGDLTIRDPEWKKEIEADGLSLWKAKESPPRFFFTTKAVVIPDRLKRLEYMFGNAWDPKDAAVLVKPLSGVRVSSKKADAQFEVIKSTDGYRRIRVQNKTDGILTFPVTYDPHWTARWTSNDSSSKPLVTLISNSIFLGIVVPRGTGELEVRYDDKPRPSNQAISITGIILLICTGYFFKKRSKLKVFVYPAS
ncbi:MAG: hypothetical protein G01um101466_377 [Parcubacteria group bacterium Gr01-1014_66]|nr:MAG: hypothetical protein G01um101466_377 [Parcubacteria group bacterium Gr01-1014_66]